MVLLKNWPVFNVVILQYIGQENVFYDVLEQKSAFQDYKKKKCKKIKKLRFFPKGVSPWFCSKTGCYFTYIHVGQENVFYNVLKRLF